MSFQLILIIHILLALALIALILSLAWPTKLALFDYENFVTNRNSLIKIPKACFVESLL